MSNLIRENIFYDVNKYNPTSSQILANEDTQLVYPILQDSSKYNVAINKARIDLSTIPLTQTNIPYHKYAVGLKQGSVSTTAFVQQKNISTSNFLWALSETGEIQKYTYSTTGVLTPIGTGDTLASCPSPKMLLVDAYQNKFVVDNNSLFVFNENNEQIYTQSFSYIASISKDAYSRLYVAETDTVNVFQIIGADGSEAFVLNPLTTLTQNFHGNNFKVVYSISSDEQIIVLAEDTTDTTYITIYDAGLTALADVAPTNPNNLSYAQPSSLISNQNIFAISLGDESPDIVYQTSSMSSLVSDINSSITSETQVLADGLFTSHISASSSTLYGVGTTPYVYSSTTDTPYPPLPPNGTPYSQFATGSFQSVILDAYRNVYPTTSSAIVNGTTTVLTLPSYNEIQIDNSGKLWKVDSSGQLDKSEIVFGEMALFGLSSTSTSLKMSSMCKTSSTPSYKAVDNPAYILPEEIKQMYKREVTSGVYHYFVMTVANTIIELAEDFSVVGANTYTSSGTLNSICHYENGTTGYGYIVVAETTSGGDAKLFIRQENDLGASDVSSTTELGITFFDYTLSSLYYDFGTPMTLVGITYNGGTITEPEYIFVIYTLATGVPSTFTNSYEQSPPTGIDSRATLCKFQAFSGSYFGTAFFPQDGGTGKPYYLNLTSYVGTDFGVQSVAVPSAPDTYSQPITNLQFIPEYELVFVYTPTKAYIFTPEFASILLYTPQMNNRTNYYMSGNMEGIYTFDTTVNVELAGNPLAISGLAFSPTKTGQVYVSSASTETPSYTPYVGFYSAGNLEVAAFPSYPTTTAKFLSVFKRNSLSTATTIQSYSVSNQELLATDNYTGNIQNITRNRSTDEFVFVNNNNNNPYLFSSVPSTLNTNFSVPFPGGYLVATRGGAEIDAGDYPIYSIATFIEAINAAFLECWARLKELVPVGYIQDAPVLSLNYQTGLLTITYSGDTTSVGNGILINPSLLQYVNFQSIPSSITGFNILVLPPSSTSTTQTARSIYQFNELQRILFNSNTIYVVGSYKGNNISTNTITDIDVPDDVVENIGTTLLYEPTFLRPYTLSSNMPLQRVQLQIYYQYRDGSIFPLYLNPAQNFTAKLQFMNKTM